VLSKHQIKPLVPCLAAIGRGDGGFANAAIHKLPDATNMPLRPTCGMIHAAQNHFTILPVAFDDKQLASIRDPTLMPDFS
jgi:hypothetical protein